MDKKEMLKSMMSLKSKLMATVSMLLVSAILLTNVSYAWFVLSTAPEVSGVSTTSGANGALEIALQSTVKQGGTTTRAEITSDVGDSGALATVNVTESNKTWGNIVDVTTGYGLDSITLYPSRLNIDTSNNYKVNPSSYLQVPQYGTDGRISTLNPTQKTYYVETDNGGTFEENVNYGVNVLGFTQEMDETADKTIFSYYPRETVRREAIGKVANYRQNLREQLLSLLAANATGLYDIMFTMTLRTELGLTWDADNTKTVESLVTGLLSMSAELENSLRWALLAYAVADTKNYSPDDSTELVALGDIYKGFTALPLEADDTPSILSIAEANRNEALEIDIDYGAIINAVKALQNLQSRLLDAKSLLEAGLPVNAGSCLVDVVNTYVMRGTDPNKTSQDAVPFAAGIMYDVTQIPPITEDDLYMTGNTDPASTNLFSAMATILGDYETDLIAYMSLTQFEIKDQPAEGLIKCALHLKVTSEIGQKGIDSFSVENNVGTLQVVYNSVQTKAEGDIPMQITRGDVTAYGYSIDLAFRSSENGGLMLQQEATSRVSNSYDDPLNQNANLQGGGSTMTFEIFGNLSGEQAAELVRNIYVVFMDTDTGSIYAVGIADEIETNLEDVTATITLYSVDYDAMEEAGDGIIRLGNPVPNNIITQVQADEEYYITAVVFLNGDTVSSGDVAPQGLSLVGSINLQFALDGVNLEAMRYDDYITRPAETTEPQTP